MEHKIAQLRSLQAASKHNQHHLRHLHGQQIRAHRPHKHLCATDTTHLSKFPKAKNQKNNKSRARSNHEDALVNDGAEEERKRERGGLAEAPALRVLVDVPRKPTVNGGIPLARKLAKRRAVPPVCRVMAMTCQRQDTTVQSMRVAYPRRNRADRIAAVPPHSSAYTQTPQNRCEKTVSLNLQNIFCAIEWLTKKKSIM